MLMSVIQYYFSLSIWKASMLDQLGHSIPVKLDAGATVLATSKKLWWPAWGAGDGIMMTKKERCDVLLLQSFEGKSPG